MTRQKKSFVYWGILVFCIVAGFFINLLKFTLFFNVDIIFGSFFVILVVSLYGPVWGGVAGFIVAGSTFILWNHPYAIIIFTAEALFIGFFYEWRSGNLVLFDILYWFVLGMPLVYLFYHGVMKLDNNGSLLIMFKQAINGIANTLFARLVLMAFGTRFSRLFRPRGWGNWPFSAVLFNTIMIFVLLPSMLFTAIASRLELKDIENEIYYELKDVSGSSNEVIGNWMGGKQTEFKSDRYALRDESFGEYATESVGSLLESLRRNDDDCDAMGVLDTEGNVIDISVKIGVTVDEKGLAQAVPPAEERSYETDPFISPMRKSVPGETNADILMFSPIRHDNRITGIFFCVYNTDNLEFLFRNLLEGRDTEIFVIDSEMNSVFHWGNLFTHDIPGIVTLYEDSKDDGVTEFRKWMPPQKRNTTVMSRWKDAVYIGETPLSVAASQATTDMPWKIYTVAGITPRLDKLYANSFRYLLVILVLIFLSTFISRLLAARYVTPVETLRIITTNLPSRLNEKVRVSWPRSMIAEITGLITNIRHMANSLLRSFAELKSANKDLAAQKEAAENANRAKSRFLANMSHDIRTPMTAIYGITEMLLEDENMRGVRKERIETIRQSSSVLLQLLNNILDLSKIEAGKLIIERTDFNLRETLDSLVALFRVSADVKGVSLSCKVAESVPEYLKGDTLRIQQVLMNLIGNALKFTESGEILIEIEREDGHVGETGKADASVITLAFSVRDTGIGIPPEKQLEIFESFSQADTSISRKYGGSGLGLSITRELVKLMNGTISLTSTPGKGSNFCFTIKLSRGRAPDQPADRELIPELGLRDGKKVRILLADDEIINRKIGERLLGKLRFEVKSVPTGEEALTALSQEDFDLVFMDVHMPGLSGIEATRIIRAGKSFVRNRDVPVVALTAGLTDEDVAACKEAGMNDVAQKPFKIAEIVGMVRRHVIA